MGVGTFSLLPSLENSPSYVFPTQHGDTHKSGQCPGPPSVSLAYDFPERRQAREPGRHFSAGPRDGPGMSTIISSAAFHITELKRSDLSRARAPDERPVH